jgi:hypothetical protein
MTTQTTITPTTTNTISQQQPRLADLSAGVSVTGIYRVNHYAMLSNATWKSPLISLRDGSRTLICLPTDSQVVLSKHLLGRAVRVQFKTVQHPKFGLQGRIDSLAVVDDIPASIVLDILPYTRKMTALAKQFRDMIATASAQGQSFVREVLSDDNVARGLMLNPASRTFHHTERGGLLRHSMEVARRVSQKPGLCQEEQDISFLAAFLHDIGKSLTLNRAGFHTPTGALVRHESLTLEICARALRNLAAVSRRLADELRHIWTAAYRGQYGIAPMTDLVDAIREADRLSARSDKAASPTGPVPRHAGVQP